MLETLKALDRQLFITLNNQHSDFWNPIMVLVSEKVFWFPAYFILICYLIFEFRKRSISMLLLLGCAVAAADSVSSGFFKPYFARLRPCHDPSLSEVINIVSGCGGQFGFMSSHAANTFALAIFMSLVLSSNYRVFKIILIIWAIAVSYSRIYLGVHYPGDVLAGALLGAFFAWIFATLYKYSLERLSFFRS